MGGGGEVKALLVLRHEATNVLERAVAFLFFNGIQQLAKVTFSKKGTHISHIGYFLYFHYILIIRHLTDKTIYKHLPTTAASITKYLIKNLPRIQNFIRIEQLFNSFLNSNFSFRKHNIQITFLHITNTVFARNSSS